MMQLKNDENNGCGFIPGNSRSDSKLNPMLLNRYHLTHLLTKKLKS